MRHGPLITEWKLFVMVGVKEGMMTLWSFTHYMLIAWVDMMPELY